MCTCQEPATHAETRKRNLFYAVVLAILFAIGNLAFFAAMSASEPQVHYVVTIPAR